MQINNNTEHKISQVPFGHIFQEVTRNSNLSIGAKGLYAYLASFAGNKGNCFPSLSTILKEMSISENTFYKYAKELEDAGVINRQQRKGKTTIYHLVDHVLTPSSKSKKTKKKVSLKFKKGMSSKNKDKKENNKINNTIDNNSIDNNKCTESEEERYLNQNKYFSRNQKQSFLKFCKNIKNAKMLEKVIFASKKIATEKHIDFKSIPLVSWISKIFKYAKNAKNVKQYIFSSLINEFKELLEPETIIISKKPTFNTQKPVIIPEWEENKGTQSTGKEELDEESKKAILARLEQFNAQTKVAF